MMLYNRAVQYPQHHGKQENYLQFKDETWLILSFKTRRFGINTLYDYSCNRASFLHKYELYLISHFSKLEDREGKYNSVFSSPTFGINCAWEIW